MSEQPEPERSIPTINKWVSNGALIADLVRLGDLRDDWWVLDPTFGEGTFWSVWRPKWLVTCDLDPAKSPNGESIDFTCLPFDDRSFDAVVFDPPYKLNGTPTGPSDARYGTHQPRTWQQRMALIRAGARECARVADKMLIVKCQDQVVSSVIRWQTRAVADEVEPLGFGLKHRFEFLSHRPQPAGRKQLNPLACSSQLLVFQRDWWWSDLPRPTEKDDDHDAR